MAEFLKPQRDVRIPYPTTPLSQRQYKWGRHAKRRDATCLQHNMSVGVLGCSSDGLLIHLPPGAFTLRSFGEAFKHPQGWLATLRRLLLRRSYTKDARRWIFAKTQYVDISNSLWMIASIDTNTWTLFPHTSVWSPFWTVMLLIFYLVLPQKQFNLTKC